ncbi:TOBE domain-containing protein [Frigoribacterium sp. 2-23]|uniref:TOBE domain-containing protein n=1 Tax=Frigoribacterium sp. 2-23 TaxID=3415006 RepID=UPI003C6F28DD
MTETLYRVSEAAALIGVSDDTIRRWADAGRLDLVAGPGGRLAVPGRRLAELAREHATQPVPPEGEGRVSQRNRLAGIVTAITRDGVMAQVDVQAGPFRIVSLISREAADELGLEVGSSVVASAKATNVGIDLGSLGHTEDTK